MKLQKNKKGAISIIVAISMVVLLLFAALVIDIGMIAVNKSKLQNACDAAALAGAQELPEDTTKAETVARQYAIDNGVEDEYIGISFSEGNTKITVAAMNKPVGFFFAKVIGINEGQVSVKAAAINAPIASYGKGLKPFGVVDSEYKKDDIVVLKTGADDSYHGNFSPVDLDGVGANVYNEIIKTGSNTTHYIGELIDTETGNMVQKTFNGVQYLIDGCHHIPTCTSTKYNLDCSRVITVPLVDSLRVSGKTQVTITGFARFFINDIVKYQGKNGHVEITGTFIEEVDVGEVDPNQKDYKFRGVKLVE